MRTNPFTDTWLFVAGQWDDEMALGVGRWLYVAAFVGLLAASLFIALREWRTDPSQRTGRAISWWLIRVLVGYMWLVNTTWKLPLFSQDNGLYDWTSKEKMGAAFGWLRYLVENLFLQPIVFDVINLGTLMLELTFAVSLILGLGTRAMGAIGVLFVGQLWLGLYRVDSEWPWTYVFLMMLMGLFALEAAGRCLGLDAWLRRERRDDASARGRLLALAT